MVKLGGWGGVMKRLILAGIGGALALAPVLAATGGRAAAQAPAAAAAPQDNDRLDLPLEGAVTEPDWAVKPSGEDLAHLYPPLAQVLRLSGRTSMRCQALTSGELRGCVIVSEQPKGFGFGDAALLSAAGYRMKPSKLDNHAVVSNVTVPMVWTLGAPPLPQPTPEELTDVYTKSQGHDGRNPTSEQVALGRQLVADEQFKRMIQRSVDREVQQIIHTAELRGAPSPDAATETRVIKRLESNFDVALEPLLEARARRFAMDLSPDDLSKAAAFLNSPAGKDFLAEQDKMNLHNRPNLGLFGAAAISATQKEECSHVSCIGIAGTPR